MSTMLPTNKSNRIHSLDIIRGFALLGILLMNIQSFAMPMAAYMNPTAFGDLTGVNKWVWLLSHLLVDSKFMAMFSLLFGAGVLLFCQHLETRQKKSLSLHYRRMFWLLMFGLIHAHLIWSGDVLFLYAVCGFWIYFFRNASIRTLWVTGILLLAIGWIFSVLTQYFLRYMPAEEVIALQEDWLPPSEVMQAEVAAMIGTWLQQFQVRTEDAFFMETFVLLYMMLWRAGGMMLIGMALYKQGLFTGQLDTRYLLRNALVCLTGGLALVGYGLIFNFRHEFAMEYSQFQGSQFNYVGSVLVALGYVHLLAWLIQKNLFSPIFKRLSYVGRMAFTNYISHSLICTFIFYGFGLGLFGTFERWQQLVVVIIIWIAQLFWSRWWLTRYQYGPLEWFWRVLTYWNPLSERIKQDAD